MIRRAAGSWQQRLNRPAGFETYEEACVEGTKGVDKVGFSVK